MAVKNYSDYPVLVELIHNDVPIGTYEDPFGQTVNVYRINSVHYLNRTNEQFTAIVADQNGRTWTGTVQPGSEGTVSIPASRRPASIPLTFSLSFVEV